MQEHIFFFGFNTKIMLSKLYQQYFTSPIFTVSVFGILLPPTVSSKLQAANKPTAGAAAIL